MTTIREHEKEMREIFDKAEMIGVLTCPKCGSKNVSKKPKLCRCNGCGYEAKIFPEYVGYKHNDKKSIVRLKYWAKIKKEANKFLKDRGKRLAKRIRLLSKKEIDELFYRCGWSQGGDPEFGYKSLEDETLDFIKESDKNADIWINHLLYDAGIEDLDNEIIVEFKRILEDIEKKKKKLSN